MEVLLKMAVIAQHMKDKQSDEDLYYRHSTDLKIKSIEEVEDGKVIIRTYSTMIDSGIVSENWVELYFTMEYDLTHKKATKHLIDCGYDEYGNRGISRFDFLKIKAIGRKVYKFIISKAMSNIKAIQRPLDLEKYDDVKRIRNAYWKRVMKYINMVTDVEMYQQSIEFDKDRFLRDKEKLEECNILLKQRLEDNEDEFSYDESNSSV